MRINSTLDEFASFDPTKESKPESIKQLCDDIHEGKITLPIFQTYIRWQLEKSVALLNFQLFGKAAVAPISVNRIENREVAVQQVSFLERNLIDDSEIHGKDSVNDGQQRLTCNYKAYIDHEDFKCIVLDVSKGKFLINTGSARSSQIPVGKLYNKDPRVFREYIKEHKPLQKFEVQDLLQRVRNKFLGYYYTVNYARDLNEEEQRQWFEVLNLAGSRVAGVQVDLTEMLVKGVDYYREYSSLIFDRMSDANLEHLFTMKTTEISIPLAMLNASYEKFLNRDHSPNFSPIPSDVKASTICKMEADEIRELFKMSLDALNRAIEFIEDNTLSLPERIDYVSYLSGAFTFIGDRGLSLNEIEYLREWYSTTSFDNLGNSDRRHVFSVLIERWIKL